MGTLGVRSARPADDEQITPPGLTTPDAADVAELLADLAAAAASPTWRWKPPRTASTSAAWTA